MVSLIVVDICNVLKPRLSERQVSRGGLALHKKKKTKSKKFWYEDYVVVHDDSTRLELEYMPDSVLAFSCTQAPYHHPDALDFLEAVKNQFQPEFIVCCGDEADHKSLKRIYTHPDDMSPQEELERTREFLADLFIIFPEAVCLTSNHVADRISFAQAQANLASPWLVPWRDLIGAPETWIWRDYLIMGHWLFEHGHKVSKGSRASIQEDTVKRFGRPLSVIRGHHHSEFGEHIKPVWVTPERQIRMAYVGCLMDRKEVTYTRTATMLGCVVILHGAIRAIPLVTDRHGRWVGSIPES